MMPSFLNLKHRLTRRPLVVIATLLVALTPVAAADFA